MSWLLLLLACGPGAEAIATGMSSDNPAVREDMVAAGKLVNDPVVVEALVLALQDPSADIRVASVESLAELEAFESVPAIVERLEDSEPRVQKAAVEALGRLGDPQAVGPLVDYVEARRHGRVPLNAIWALGVLGDARALPLLAQLREHADPYVVYNACNALREIGDVKAQDEAPLETAPVPAEIEQIEQPVEEPPAPEQAPAQEPTGPIKAVFPGG